MARSAYREAVGYFEQALSALPHLPEQRDTIEQAIDLRLALRTALRPLGEFGRILVYLHEAEALAETLDDPRRLGRVSALSGKPFLPMGEHDQAIATAQRALALAAASGEVVLHALANHYLGRAYEAQGDYRRAIDCFGQTVASLEGRGATSASGRFSCPPWSPVPGSPRAMPNSACSLRAGPSGRRAADGRGSAHPGSLMLAFAGLGLLALRQGDLPRALPRLERAMGICQDADFPAIFPMMAAALGAAYTLDGRVADAVALLTQAMEQTTAMERVIRRYVVSPWGRRRCWLAI